MGGTRLFDFVASLDARGQHQVINQDKSATAMVFELSRNNFGIDKELRLFG